MCVIRKRSCRRRHTTRRAHKKCHIFYVWQKILEQFFFAGVKRSLKGRVVVGRKYLAELILQKKSVKTTKRKSSNSCWPFSSIDIIFNHLMTGKMENFKFTENSPTFKSTFNPIWWPLLSDDEEKYTKTNWEICRKMIKRNFNWIKTFHTSKYNFLRPTLDRDFFEDLSSDQRPLCSFCATPPEVHSRYFSIRREFSIFCGKTSCWSNTIPRWIWDYNFTSAIICYYKSLEVVKTSLSALMKNWIVKFLPIMSWKQQQKTMSLQFLVRSRVDSSKMWFNKNQLVFCRWAEEGRFSWGFGLIVVNQIDNVVIKITTILITGFHEQHFDSLRAHIFRHNDIKSPGHNNKII